MTGTGPPSSAGASRWSPLLAALIFLAALNLRSPLTSVGPVLPQISLDHGLSEGVAGLLGALPLIAFAVISPLVHHGSSRLGADRLLALALLFLSAGILIRSYGAGPGLWAGTAVIGCAIAVGNVLVPALVRRDYPLRISRTTAIYSACMGSAGALAAGIAVPVARVSDWNFSLALWAAPALLVALLWLARTRVEGDVRAPRVPAPPSPPAPEPAAGVSVWRRPRAWLVTAFMGLQSTSFYILNTWLPTIGTAAGFSAEQAGAHLFALHVTGIVAGLLIPRLLRRHDTQVGATIACTVPILAGALGLAFLPGLSALWAVVAGAGTGSSLVVALTLISLRGRTQAGTTRLSGMAQSLGYLLAAIGPVAAGLLAEASGHWQAPLLMIAALAAAQIVVGVAVGRDPDPAPGRGRPGR